MDEYLKLILILISSVIISSLILSLLQSIIDWTNGKPRKTLNQYSVLISLLRVKKCWKVKGDCVNYFIVFKSDSFLTIGVASNYVKAEIFYTTHVASEILTEDVIYSSTIMPERIDTGVCFVSAILFYLVKIKMSLLSNKSETLDDTSILHKILIQDVIQRQRDKKIQKILD